MAIGGKEQASRIIPSDTGINQVFLKSVPEVVEDDKYTTVNFPFIDVEESEFLLKIFDPFNATTEKKKNTAFGRLLHVLGTMMPKELYEELKKYDESEDDDIRPFIAHTMTFLEKVPNLLEIPFDIVLGYNDKGFLSTMPYGDFISSEFKKKKLMFDPSVLTLVPVSKKRNTDNEGGGSDDNDM